ncbi:AI-2E family transporter [Proteiniclasticum sp. SCR006]|uniref:AI-2E family transporter n=1 Tax=Proteiniclasticum aestuarii TaxID=2817862 RepID=A0A939HBA6_9CLOT|nr:AI-2E family transporter [Proteiniclasticum aestuarii]MBO1265999.1 AI-2E family transporter [Proteiniclasticum aestuarii]
MILDKKTVKSLITIIFSAILFAWALKHIPFILGVFGTILKPMIPLIIGASLAFVLNIYVKQLERFFAKIEKKKLKRALSIVVALLTLVLILALVLLIVIPEMARTFENIGKMLPGFFEDAKTWLEGLLGSFPMFQDYLNNIDFSLENIGETLMDIIMVGGNSLADFTVSVATSLFSGAMNILLGLIFAIYILFDKENLGRQVRRILYAYLPEKRVDQLLGISVLVSDIFQKFVTGQLTEAVILGMMFVVSMLIFGFPYAVVVGVLVTLTAIIPIVGAFIAMAIGFFLIFVNSPVQALWFLVLFFVLQQIEGDFIYPKVVGNSIGLPALWVLVAVMVGGGLYGILGILLAVPIASVFYVLIKRNVGNRLDDKDIDMRKYK